MKQKELIFKKINQFPMKISYVDIDSTSPYNVFEDHIHSECEIYINLSGDVSFSVENSFYPIMPGNIIITRPFEYHHCVYHSNQRHRHFWLLFDVSGNEALFDIFFNRKAGTNNLIIPDPAQTEEIICICNKLYGDTASECEKYFCFFSLINILTNANILNAPNNYGNDDIIDAINYINDNLSSSISVRELAKKCNVSVSTLERHFFSTYSISPSEYIKKKRLANAAKLLSGGISVSEAASRSGFSDCSKFIVTFKKKYGITPLKYKKAQSHTKQN